jgi:predicted CXXCH cytochrome family protein
MKKSFLLAATMLLALSAAFAQTSIYTYNQGTAADTRTNGLGAHDIKDGTTYLGCLGCHHPHNAPQASGKLMLFRWALSSTASYDTYGGGTLGTPSDSSDVQAQSYVCLSCHDGAVSGAGTFAATGLVGSGAGTGVAPKIIGLGAAGGAGKDLTSNHPVNQTYGSGTDMATPSGSVTTGFAVDVLPLYGGTTAATATVQCTTCHNQHDTTNVPFLRAANTNNYELCIKCHNNL